MKTMNRKVVALLVVALAALIGLVYTIEHSARPMSDRAGVMAEGEGEGHSH
jgi:hypothetical protein